MYIYVYACIYIHIYILLLYIHIYIYRVAKSSHLECHLDRVQAQVGVLPLLEGLEGGRDGAEVGPVEALEDRDRLGVVLRGGAADEREAGQVDGHVDQRAAHGEEVLLDRPETQIEEDTRLGFCSPATLRFRSPAKRTQAEDKRRKGTTQISTHRCTWNANRRQKQGKGPSPAV